MQSVGNWTQARAMPKETVQILPAAERHLPAIARLAGVIWRQHYPGIISPAQIEFMLGWMYAPDRLKVELSEQGVRFERLLVEGRLTGFAAYGPTDEAGLFKLHKLYVHPERHGTGLGRLLLTHCEAAASQSGASRLILAVNKRNLRAIRLYELLGYSTLESVTVPIGGGFVMDDYVMGKTLLKRQEKPVIAIKPK